MHEIAPDRPDFDEYDAELARVHRMYKRLAHQLELEDERMDEEDGSEREICRNAFKHSACGNVQAY